LVIKGDFWDLLFVDEWKIELKLLKDAEILQMIRGDI